MVMSAPNGARRTRTDHAALPVTPRQLADCAHSLLDQSVAVLHLHVRDDEERHTLSADKYRDAIKAVRASVGDAMIVQITTEAVGMFSSDQQMAVVRQLRPEATSLALRELCPDESKEAVAGHFFEWLVRERIWPQYILYNADDVARFDRLRRKGFFSDDRPFCMLVMGQYANERAGEIDDLTNMLSAADCDQFPWAVCCFGQNENEAALAAVKKNGHVRLGFENNVRLRNGSIAKDNAELIAQFHSSLGDSARRPSSADDIREFFIAS